MGNKNIKYPEGLPFTLSINHPEYIINERHVIKEENLSYHAIRESLNICYFYRVLFNNIKMYYDAIMGISEISLLHISVTSGHCFR